jgi:hypothetical protein
VLIKLESEDLVGPIKIDEAGKILSRKIKGAFHWMIKLDPEDLVGLTTCKRKTLQRSS